MALSMKSGSVSCALLGDEGFVAAVHGGAGPEDPKGDAANSAWEAICEVAKSLDGCNARSICLPKSTQKPTSVAEWIALQGASLLENNVNFNAGYGAALQEDGNARVSASFMESQRQKFSAVMNALEVKNPSQLAYFLQSERFCVLDGTGTQNLMRDLAIPRENLIAEHRFNRWIELKRKSILTKVADGKGTIGCATFDTQKRLAVCTSTGGVGNETVGRVGDTPTVAGNYCSNVCAVSCTGYGEQILNSAIATKICTRVSDGLSLFQACEKTYKEADAKNYGIASISLAYNANTHSVDWCMATTEDYFIWALVTPKGIIHFRN